MQNTPYPSRKLPPYSAIRWAESRKTPGIRRKERRFALLGLSGARRYLAVMFTERGKSVRLISARRATSRERREYEKGRQQEDQAAASVDPDEILPEYDFSRARPNKYASRYAADSMVVVLEPDVAAVFPTADRANEALRVLAGLIQRHKSPKPPARRGA